MVVSLRMDDFAEELSICLQLAAGCERAWPMIPADQAGREAATGCVRNRIDPLPVVDVETPAAISSAKLTRVAAMPNNYGKAERKAQPSPNLGPRRECHKKSRCGHREEKFDLNFSVCRGFNLSKTAE
jgi:hypothetical protein